ncbi:MAG: SnoaL-like domain-containing protein [Bacteroidota bacterium]
MTTQEVANQLVSMCREGKFEEVFQDLYSTEIESIEPKGSVFPHEVKGIDALVKKGKQWEELIQEVHTSEVSDPIVAENFFSITMKTKVTLKGMDEPTNMDEVCVYQVQNGKVVSEQFFYTPVPVEV